MAATAAVRYNDATVKLLIISRDCDPKTELPLSAHPPLNRNAVVEALTHAKYWFSMPRLPPPPPNAAVSRNPRASIEPSPTKIAILSLHASKKAALLYGCGDYSSSDDANYQITYDETLMDDLPSYCELKGLPRFHLFTSLPEDLQLSIVGMLDGVGFARMRCVSRWFSRLRWSRDFDILKYSRPDVNKQSAVQLVEESSKDEDEDGGGGGGGGGGFRFQYNALFRFVSTVCFVVAAYVIFSDVRSEVCVSVFDEDDDYNFISSR
ncbi:hypothetical protein ACP275_05G116400 [Erythranthe tilingii]